MKRRFWLYHCEMTEISNNIHKFCCFKHSSIKRPFESYLHGAASRTMYVCAFTCHASCIVYKSSSCTQCRGWREPRVLLRGKQHMHWLGKRYSEVSHKQTNWKHVCWTAAQQDGAPWQSDWCWTRCNSRVWSRGWQPVWKTHNSTVEIAVRCFLTVMK